MITCHLINVLKAFQSPLQDKSQNWNQHAHTENTHTHTFTEQCHWLSSEAAAMNILCLCILKCNTKQRMPVRFTDGKAAEAWRLEDEGKRVRLDICCLHYSSGQTCKWWRVRGVHLIPNNKWYQSQMGAIKDLLGEWEEGLKRKRVSQFVLSPGALKRSNYHTAVKMYTSSSHWNALTRFSATHRSSSRLLTQAPQ